jgi:NAD(P)-dependent dehydrogenase (short-subunit alcohol dehydrogenase family)
LAFDCDVTDEKKLAKVIDFIKRQHKKIDIYCSNAGIVFPPNYHNDKVTKHSPQEWNKILQVNLLSHLAALRLLLPDWELGKGDGIFCMTASVAGLLTMVGDASYGVTKAAAVSLAEHLAISHGNVVQVHCLCPQAVDTPFVTGNDGINAAMTDGVVSPEYVADCTTKAIHKKEFFIFPHPEVETYFARKAKDHARWLKGMQRLRNRMMPSKL